MPLRPYHGKPILNLLPSELVDEVVGLADHGQRQVFGSGSMWPAGMVRTEPTAAAHSAISSNKLLGGWSSRSLVLRDATFIPLWVALLRKHAKSG
jgi:hypothetical protein